MATIPFVPALPYLKSDQVGFVTAPTSSFSLSQSPVQGGFFWFFVNGIVQIPALHFTLSQRTVNLSYQLQFGDNAYAIYQAVTLN
jgi:hypothetical protein